MDSKDQNSEKNPRRPFQPLVVWAQADASIDPFDPEDRRTTSTSSSSKLVADFNALKEYVAQLNAQVKELTAVVNGLQESVEHLEWDYQRHSPGGKKRHVSTENHQFPPESSQLPAYISALKSLQNLSGHELQQILKNYNLEWSRLGSEEMKREILKQERVRAFPCRSENLRQTPKRELILLEVL